jgi:hypothetical protein
MRIRNIVLWAICALALMMTFTYTYHPRQVASPSHQGPRRAPQGGHMFLLGYHA